MAQVSAPHRGLAAGSERVVLWFMRRLARRLWCARLTWRAALGFGAAVIGLLELANLVEGRVGDNLLRIILITAVVVFARLGDNDVRYQLARTGESRRRSFWHPRPEWLLYPWWARAASMLLALVAAFIVAGLSEGAGVVVFFGAVGVAWLVERAVIRRRLSGTNRRHPESLG